MSLNWHIINGIHFCHLNYKIINMNILQTPSKVGVLQSITFSHTPDEAMFVGLAKACSLKYYFVI